MHPIFLLLFWHGQCVGVSTHFASRVASFGLRVGLLGYIWGSRITSSPGAAGVFGLHLLQRCLGALCYILSGGLWVISPKFCPRTYFSYILLTYFWIVTSQGSDGFRWIYISLFIVLLRVKRLQMDLSWWLIGVKWLVLLLCCRWRCCAVCWQLIDSQEPISFNQSQTKWQDWLTHCGWAI